MKKCCKNVNILADDFIEDSIYEALDEKMETVRCGKVSAWSHKLNEFAGYETIASGHRRKRSHGIWSGPYSCRKSQI